MRLALVLFRQKTSFSPINSRQCQENQSGFCLKLTFLSCATQQEIVLLSSMLTNRNAHFRQDSYLGIASLSQCEFNRQLPAILSHGLSTCDTLLGLVMGFVNNNKNIVLFFKIIHQWCLFPPLPEPTTQVTT